MQINIEKVKEMADKHLEWLKANTKDELPLAINSNKLVKAHFHVEEGRGGYFAPESGTSESQFLLILGMLEMYKSTNETKWLTEAESLMEAALTTLYPSDLPTEEFNEDYIFSPHWLFNAANSFIAERYYLDKEVTVENGRGTFACEASARKIFSARSKESTLLWENPFAEIVGIEYEIKSYSTDGNAFTFELKDTTVNGVIKVVYSDLGGPVIEPNETYEAWPVWRKLKDGEIACAIDSLWWSYSCFKLLSELTNRQHYKSILKNLKGLIKFACSISNAEDYFSIDKTTNDPFSKVGTYGYQDRTPEATFSRHQTNGSVVIDIPQGVGSVQFGQGDMNELVSKDRGLRFKYKSSKSVKLNLVASTTQKYDESCRFICTLKPGASEMQEIDLNWDDFVRIDNILFDIVYKPTNESRYTSENSRINLSTSQDDNSSREYRIIEFIRGMEGEGVGAWWGHAQYQNFYGDLEEIPSIHYALDGKIAARIKDTDGFYWSKTLEQSASFKKVKLSDSDFKLADYQENEGTPTTIVWPIKEFVFEAVDKNPTLKLKEIGDFINMNSEDSIRGLSLEYWEEEAINLEIHYLRPIVLDKYQYAPYVAPFTLNTINHRLDDWRGTPYVGYQCPWIWVELDDQAGVNTVLKFIRESQYAYQRITQKEDWFFCQVFIWDRWDSKEYGEPNTFTWNGPDPNTHWAGFQYRTIETVAKTLYMQPLNSSAQIILESFFDSLEKFWNIEEGLIPTEFNENGEVKSEYKDPHGLALILRSAIFAYLSNVVDKQRCTQIIEKSLNALIDIFDNQTRLVGTWSVKNGEWYQFHSGEILHSLALLLRIKKGDIRTELEKAKRNYDIKHEALKNTINQVISDKKFDKDTETNPLDIAFKEYNVAFSNFKNVAQKSIDFISSARKDEAVEESKNYSNAQIKVAKDSIIQSVSSTYETKTEVANKINAIQVGSRNWVQNSAFKSTTDWTLNSGWSVNSSEKFRNNNSMYINRSGLTADSWSELRSNKINVEQGDKLVGSWYIKHRDCDMNSVVELWGYKADGSGRVSIANSYQISGTNANWTRYILKGTVPANVDYVQLAISHRRNGIIYAAMPQVEYGNTATDWSPAPEDFDSIIDAVNNELKQEITNSVAGLQNQNNELIERFDDAFSDNVLSSYEKIQLQADLKVIDSQYDTMKSLVNALNDNSVNGQFTTLTARHTELHTLVDPLLKDLNTAVECSNAAIREVLFQYQLQYNITHLSVQTLVDNRLNTITTTVNTTASGVETAITKSDSALNGVNTISKHFNFTDSGWVEIFASINGSPGRFKTQITDQRLSFLDNNVEVAYMSNQKLYITQAQILDSLQLGNIAMAKTAKGGLIYQWKG